MDELLRDDVKRIVIYDNFARGKIENLAQAMRNPRVCIFNVGGEILQDNTLDAAIRGADGVFHLAALWLLQCQDYPRTAFDVNVRGTFNVMEACVKNGVKRLVYSSSASVYGDAIEVPMTEDHPFANRTFYGATKICGEALLPAYHHRYGLDFAGLRYMNVYGPRQDYKGAYVAVMMKTLDAIDRGEGPTIFGDGSEVFDFVAVEDCARANVAAMQSITVDRFYNVGTGVATSLAQLAELLRELTSCGQPTKFVGQNQTGIVRRRVGSPSLAAEEIGFTAGVTLDTGIRRLIDWRSACNRKIEMSGASELRGNARSV